MIYLNLGACILLTHHEPLAPRTLSELQKSKNLAIIFRNKRIINQSHFTIISKHVKTTKLDYLISSNKHHASNRHHLLIIITTPFYTQIKISAALTLCQYLKRKCPSLVTKVLPVRDLLLAQELIF